MPASTQDLNYFRNPFISDDIDETQLNIQHAMSLLKQLQGIDDNKELNLTPSSSQGLRLFNISILQAIEYEMTRRSDD